VELLFQLPEKVVGSSLNAEDQRRAPPPPFPFCIPSTGRVCHWAPAAKSL
jgi:hypothetical protein